jgi:two-component system response regulator PilR (NtrC family)
MAKAASSVLLIDDEPDILELLSVTIERMGLIPVNASCVKEAISRLNSQKFDLCLTDLRLPDGNGLEIVDFIQKFHSRIPVAVISAHGNMQAAVDAMKSGAFDFVSKPIDLKQLRALIESALALRNTPDDTKCDSARATPRLLGNSPAIEGIRLQIQKLGRSLAPVHIHGESGTGKELVARLIHGCSPRKENPFIAVNSSAIPAELMESEFFGHRKGSFTGAVSDNPGLFQAANGGTLFLDEIADLPFSIQAKLLRAIQERAIRPVGSHEEIPIDCRILSATHQNLKNLVNAGKFREDLFYRINVIGLDVPALRDRREDIPLLVEHILSQISQRNGMELPSVSNKAMDALMSYSFPGNIRELENMLERAIALGENRDIGIDDLGLPLSMSDHSYSGATGRRNDESLDDYLIRIESDAIIDALKQAGHNRTRAAEILGISFRSLRYKLKKYGIHE